MKTVYVGLSGGVDSSVAAALLQKEGYSVVGVYMKNWTQDLPGVKCPWKDDLNDARAVAATLDIAFEVFDFQQEYRQQVVDYMIEEYKAGRTPNPDIMCNQEIKFNLFLEAALAEGADMIATGHYARVENGQLLRGADDNKDQTYFLYRVSKEALAITLMPIGSYTKPEVRKLAAKSGLPTAGKKDSQGICFVGPVGMKAFLQQYVQTSPGPIMDKNGHEIGQHDGAIFYTIGQRSGLGVGGGKPFYVTGKNMESNTVYVTDDPEDLELYTDNLQLDHTHWISEIPKENEKLQVRLRHRGELIGCLPVKESPYGPKGDSFRVQLTSPQRAIAAGQSAVIYSGQKVLGGGIIRSAAALAARS